MWGFWQFDLFRRVAREPSPLHRLLEHFVESGMRMPHEPRTKASRQHPSIDLLVDDAHRLPVSLRVWLEQLLAQGQPIVLLVTQPPRKDIFLKLPHLELKPLEHTQIRELRREAAERQNLALSPAQLAA